MRNLPSIILSFFRSLMRGHHVRMREEHTLEHLIERFHRPLKIGLVLLVLCATAVALMFRTSECPPILLSHGDQTAATTIITEYAFDCVDSQATERARDAAAANAPLVLVLSQERNALIKSRIVGLFTLLRSDTVERAVFLRDRGIHPAIGDNLEECIGLKSFEENFFRKLDIVLGRGILDTSVLPGNTSSLREASLVLGANRRAATRLLGTFANSREAAEQLAAISLRPADLYLNPGTEAAFAGFLRNIFATADGNLLPDAVESEVMRKEVRERVKPVIRHIERGTPIVQLGQPVSQEDVDLWNAYRMHLDTERQLTFSLFTMGRLLVASFFIIVIAGVYLAATCPDFLRSARKLWLIGLTILTCMFINCLVVSYADSIAASLNIQLPMFGLFPLALAPALLTVSLDLRAGLFAGIYISFVTSMQLGNSFPTMMGGIILTFVVSYAIRGAINYRQYFTRTLFSVIATVGLLKTVQYLAGDNAVETWGDIIYQAVYNGMSTAVLALLLLFVLDGLLGVTTDMTLATLADANHPLLKRLQMEAPGTYFHSQFVASIAEQGALDIRANPIRARVAALFHDVGKLSNPEYFTENMGDLDSPHNMIKPTVSAIVIQSHVKEGVERAIKYHLPRFVRDAISQHHGTDKVGYFYQLAVNAGAKSQLDEQIFHYQGPLPAEKEIVIVSLADACEAAARSIEKPTPSKIDNLISDIFRHRLKNGQLDDAKLTLQEFAILRKSFAKSLATMYHSRISYPKQEMEKDVDAEDDDLFMQLPTVQRPAKWS